MGISKNEEVRDGYLGDLPEELRIKLMNIHKLIVDACNETFKDKNYDDIRNTAWAKTMLEEFTSQPADKNHIGSVRLYKKGKRYRCMIQISGHVDNNRNDLDHELFHDFIRNVHVSIRPKVRRKYDMALTCESEHGENFEGFDVWTKQKTAKELWELFEDKKTKKIKEIHESADNSASAGVLVAGIEELPIRLQEQVECMHKSICEDMVDTITNQDLFKEFRADNIMSVFMDNVTGRINEGASDIGYTVLRRRVGGVYEGSIMITHEYDLSNVFSESINTNIEQIFEAAWDRNFEEFYKSNPTKELVITGKNPNFCFEFQLTPEYAEKLWDYLESDESVESIDKAPITEAATPEYNVDMSEAQAKKTLRTLSQSIINDAANKKDYKVSQYTADIYANIITKNLLPIWAKGYRKFSITLDSYQSFFTFEFKIPTMTQDFVSRFVDGRESIDGLLHRNPEIKVKMSPRILHNMKNPDDAFNFFKAAIKYYSDGISKYSEKLMVEVMSLNREMKHLISTSKMSGIVTMPMQMLFVFDDVQMENRDTFKISQEDIKTINQFIKNIYSRYAAPEKEKKQIIEDLQKMVQSLRECCEVDDNFRSVAQFPEAVEKYFDGGFDKIMEQYNEKYISEQFDTDWCNKNPNKDIRYLQEVFGVKKLKKIPRDLVAYITIETECIKDANDKMMIASYCLSKIEVVEWYIELLEVGSKKYIVPHSKPYLESVRTQLLACYKKIMDTPIPKSTQRPLLDIQYPKGYEG